MNQKISQEEFDAAFLDRQLKAARNHIQLFEKVVGEEFLNQFAMVRNDTMLSIEKLYEIRLACKFLEKNNIKGDQVEIGTWRGGALAMMRLNSSPERKIIGFDTFDGHPQPDSNEFDVRGMSMQARWLQENSAGRKMAYASLQECKSFLGKLSLLHNIELIKGDVVKTLEEIEIKEISFLRIDCDWYRETLYVLEKLWDHISLGGICMFDGYGHISGMKNAVDEFFENKSIKLTHIDYSGVQVIKTTN